MSEKTAVYSNPTFDVVVGYPEKNSTRPDPWPEYLVVNRETRVVEYSHSVLYIAKSWADDFDKLVRGVHESQHKDDAGAAAQAALNFN